MFPFLVNGNNFVQWSGFREVQQTVKIEHRILAYYKDQCKGGEEPVSHSHSFHLYQRHAWHTCQNLYLVYITSTRSLVISSLSVNSFIFSEVFRLSLTLSCEQLTPPLDWNCFTTSGPLYSSMCRVSDSRVCYYTIVFKVFHS